MKEILSFRDVSLCYHSLQGETPALEHMSFSVYEGEFLSVVGPSGCGKTSVLSLLADLIKPSRGEILRYYKESPGYMLQKDHLLEYRNVEKNVQLGLEVKGMLNEESKERCRTLLSRYGLLPFLKSYPSELSGGMRQKVALIRTLATEPSLLLLDEPFSALDYQSRLRLGDEMWEIIRREKKTAILVTHDISEAVSMADRVLVFSARPARLKLDFPVPLSAAGPFLRRSEAGFGDCFERIWAELEVSHG